MFIRNAYVSELALSNATYLSVKVAARHRNIINSLKRTLSSDVRSSRRVSGLFDCSTAPALPYWLAVTSSFSQSVSALAGLRLRMYWVLDAICL